MTVESIFIGIVVNAKLIEPILSTGVHNTTFATIILTLFLWFNSIRLDVFDQQIYLTKIKSCVNRKL